jgi:hypothetical protein
MWILPESRASTEAKTNPRCCYGAKNPVVTLAAEFMHEPDHRVICPLLPPRINLVLESLPVIRPQMKTSPPCVPILDPQHR